MNQPATLNQLQNHAPREASMPAVTMGFGSLQSFELMQRAAKVLAGSTLVPTAYRAFTEKKEYGKVVGYEQNGSGLPNCIVALNMAERMRADPLMIMQNLHIIEGRPSWSSAFIVAAINTCGRFAPLRYELSRPGEPTEVEYTATEWHNRQKTQVKKKVTVRHQTCIAWTVEKGTEIPKFSLEEMRGKTLLQLCREYGVPVLESPEVSIQMAIDEGWLTKNGSKWQTIPELMLRYRCASFFGRLYAPEILMGLHTTEEVQDFIPAEADNQGVYTVDVDKLREAAGGADNEEPRPPSIPDDEDQADKGETINTATGEIKQADPEPVQQTKTSPAKRQQQKAEPEPQQQDDDFDLDME